MERYRKGRQFEYRVKRLLTRNGWKVFRCASSKPLDLIAAKNNRVLFIECKSNYREYGPEMKRLSKISRQTGFPVHLIFPHKTGELLVKVITEHDYRTLFLEEVIE